ncbi:cytochrome C [Undibacterium cyanobacteriorum]|uniref:Cytochrome C n=1 Tax=Undibacterium cyanobacteriorum TaxID=3073561 RepID=A0ABY9RM22_9BURK|nr:cytochrome C [Undibacterium sp. 20NA77.5]WMW81874.1 cytochrome C [Undibacterium sp. 20NA77.5]
MSSRLGSLHLVMVLTLGMSVTGLVGAQNGDSKVTQAASSLPVFTDSIEQRVQACVGCHGDQGRSTNQGYFPRIAGKPAGYLFNQLLNFRERKRTYPQMNYLVAHLSDAYLQEMAQYFASQNPPYAAPVASAASATVLERGKALVMQGDKQRALPACISCHGDRLTGEAPFVPGLLGLPRDYLVSQLGAWQTGNRRAHSPDCMAEISKKLRADDIEAVSTWLANQAIPQDTKPAPARATASATVRANQTSTATAWPMQCGSIQP